MKKFFIASFALVATLALASCDAEKKTTEEQTTEDAVEVVVDSAEQTVEQATEQVAEGAEQVAEEAEQVVAEEATVEQPAK